MARTTKSQSITIRYIGQTANAEVMGLGNFAHGEAKQFTDQNNIKLAKNLLETNINFEEVGE